MIEKLDSHMHVWQLDRGDYDWLTPDLAAIYRDFDIDDAWQAARAAGVTRTILVQAAASADETDYLLSIARADSRVAGVVGWVDFEAENAVAEIERRAEDRLVVGLRPMIADRADATWILQEAFRPVLEAMAHHGLVFDGHARPDLVPVMTKLAKAHPGLSIVLNHGGKPPIESRYLETWRSDVAVLADCANVSCKLSGLLTEAGPYTDDVSIGAVIDHLRASFGAERLLWGSDWPVLTLAGTYAGWAEQSERLIAGAFPEQQDKIWRTNAERIYLQKAGG